MNTWYWEHVKPRGEVIDNEITLYPIGKDALMAMLRDAGFLEIVCYKNYKKEACGGKHLPLILTCR